MDFRKKRLTISPSKTAEQILMKFDTDIATGGKYLIPTGKHENTHEAPGQMLVFYNGICKVKFEACQMHREYYKGYPKSYHPLTYFKDPEYMWQCAPEMAHVYLSFPAYHVRYKQPLTLPPTVSSTSGFPPLPERTLAGRFNKQACRVFIR